MTIDAVPNFSQEPPSTSDPDNFDVRADSAFTDLHDSIIPGINTTIEQIDSTVEQMNTIADEIEANKEITEQSKNVSLASSNFKGEWNNLTGALNIPASVSHNSKYWLLIANLTDVSSSEPGVSSDWEILDFFPNPKWVIKTADFTAEAGKNYAVDTIAGVINCTLPLSPSIDDKISFLDLKQNFSTNALNLLRNGKLIMGNVDDVSIDQNNFNFSLVYTSEGWVII